MAIDEHGIDPLKTRVCNATSESKRSHDSNLESDSEMIMIAGSSNVTGNFESVLHWSPTD